MLTQFLALQIIIPLFGGLISFILPKRFSWLFATLIVGITFLISLFLYKISFDNIELLYNFGGWTRSIGIEYKLNRLNGFFLLLVSFISLLNIIAMRSLVLIEIDPQKTPLFFGLILIFITGLLGITLSNDIFNIYVMLEVIAISSYALVASAKNPASSTAAFDYLIFGTIGSTFILFGIGFIYALVGSLNLNEINEVMPAMLNKSSAKAGVALIIFGVLMKAALFPLSAWLVNIYQNAPSFISSMLSSCSNKIGIYLLLKFYFEVFSINKIDSIYFNNCLSLVALLAIIICALLAFYQNNLKRLLGYSSLSQIGFIVFAISLNSNIAIAGALIYCITHALEKTTLFLTSGLLPKSFSEDLNKYAGIGKKHPLLGTIIIINLLSTIGFPLTAGFIGKLEIFSAAFAENIWLSFALILVSLSSILYALKLVELISFKKENQEIINLKLNGTCLWILILLTILNLYLGINGQYLLAL